MFNALSSSINDRHFATAPLHVRHKQDWGRTFILFIPLAAVLTGSDARNDAVEPASGFVIQKHHTSCFM